MLNAAEAAMDAMAEDDAERESNRARLYAPPPQLARRRGRGGGRRVGMSRSQVMDLLGQVAAEDAALAGRAGRAGPAGPAGR